MLLFNKPWNSRRNCKGWESAEWPPVLPVFERDNWDDFIENCKSL